MSKFRNMEIALKELITALENDRKYGKEVAEAKRALNTPTSPNTELTDEEKDMFDRVTASIREAQDQMAIVRAKTVYGESVAVISDVYMTGNEMNVEPLAILVTPEVFNILTKP